MDAGELTQQITRATDYISFVGESVTVWFSTSRRSQQRKVKVCLNRLEIVALPSGIFMNLIYL